ncbi:hypothetical protein DYB37_010399 [Aphanomyces astaci]|uniref:Phospholipid-transporting ATPase n=2 Tax=Aphanomyces astaci TaxID=112090 RepID=A0A3R7F7Y0_APHAT|nr:hypothetical protein DYB37_010399 [Aphanomyces astaci]
MKMGEAYREVATSPKPPPGSTFIGSETSLLSNSFRHLWLNPRSSETHGPFCTNVVVTSKYTKWSFLPKFTVESFAKLANAYFLLVSILQCIPAITNTGWPSTLPVLMFILTVDGTLAIIEDRRRHLADDEANSASCRVVFNGNLVAMPWSALQVGHIVKLDNRGTAPADLLILAVHEVDVEHKAGICYVETKSLDGETNLKLRQAMESTMHAQDEVQVSALHGRVECEQPNKAINRFAGSFFTDQPNGSIANHPISIQNIILRGCQLRNTEWMYGLVLNTGPDTKIMQSFAKPETKWSSINDHVNVMIKWLLAMLLVACGQYFLLLYQMIPVSLYVTISTVMLIQAMLMALDLDMYYDVLDSRMIVRTMALNEELGQISYIFSDKTGTLTCNVMEFRKCSINGVSYGLGTTEIGMFFTKIPTFLLCFLPYVNFHDPKLHQKLTDIPLNSSTNALTNEAEFFLHLAICHTVIPEQATDKHGDAVLRYSASSPDEQALVSAAKFFGFAFESRGLGVARVRVTNKSLQQDPSASSELWEFKVLDVLEFNSDRKRMSCVVQDPNGAFMLLTKGADNVITPLLANDNDADVVAATLEQLQTFADDGLRTLTIAKKVIPTAYYHQWTKRYKAACASLDQIDKRKNGHPNDIDACMVEMEQDLVLLGATAIEDKLQDNVPRAIARLMEAGMKVWVLTGDKQETAINIAYACQLMDNDMMQYVFNLDEYPDLASLRASLALCVADLDQVEITRRSLVIDGDALEMVMADTDDACAMFLKVAMECASVVCCRVSPSQKAEVVGLVRANNVKARTLAIGDGANDVAMIQRAHVGVGICGMEGMQAVNSSDYAIGQFYFLEKLLLHHGRLNYVRMSKLVGYMFYKNIILVLAQYFFLFTTGSSGQKEYSEVAFQLYNLAFTSLPIGVLGVFDYDVPWAVGQLYPALYKVGISGDLFNTLVLFKWISASIFEAGVIFASNSSSRSVSRTNSGFAFSADPHSSMAEGIMITQQDDAAMAAALKAGASRVRLTRLDRRSSDFSTDQQHPTGVFV